MNNEAQSEADVRKDELDRKLGSSHIKMGKYLKVSNRGKNGLRFYVTSDDKTMKGKYDAPLSPQSKALWDMIEEFYRLHTTKVGGS